MGEPAIVPADRLFLEAPEVAEIFRCDHRTVLKELKEGRMPGFKVGAHWRIPAAWVREQAGMGDRDAAS